MAAFCAGSETRRSLSGINGIGVVLSVDATELASFEQRQRASGRQYKVYPEHENPEKFPILFIEPESANTAAIGLDLGHEANRRQAAVAARDSGMAQVTGPIILVQDARRTPGFLFYVPFYDTVYGSPPDTVAQRQQRLTGFIYAPFVVKNLIAGTLDMKNRRVALQLRDGDGVLFDEFSSAANDAGATAHYATSIDVPLYGRLWTFELHSTREFDTATASFQPIMILIAGLIGNVLLVTMFLSLSRARREALVFADKVNDELVQKTAALTYSNGELASFAYTASHDLRAPVRGIGHVTAYLREDLEPYLATDECPPDVKRNIDRLDQQTDRMRALIEGILAYSQVGGVGAVARFNLESCVDELRDTLEIEPDQLQVREPLPAFDTDSVRLQQVLGNLIGNAFKYHEGPERSEVVVSHKTRDDRCVFRVSDNGPGIDPRYHDRIFEVFQKLESKDSVEGSGVGLSIVKRAVEHLGGTIRVVSESGTGATFEFDWPRRMPEVRAN